MSNLNYIIFTLVITFLQIAKCELLFVVNLFRHGARGPEGKYYDYFN